MVKDDQEVMEALRKVVEEETHCNENKEENKKNKCNADSAEMQTLDEEIGKYVEIITN